LLLFYATIATLSVGGPDRFFAVPPGPIFLLLLTLTIISERVVRPAVSRGRLRDRGTAALLAWAMILIPTIALLDHYWLQPWLHPLDWSRGWLATGVALAAAGTLVRVIAIRKLGAFFSRSVRIDDAHEIVQDGIYRWLRHPSYTGLLLVWTGYVTIFSSLWGYLAMALLFLPALLLRIRTEEKALHECFEGEYQAYCARTWRLVPFLY
jgi:protein-S-isoprenylcysteine O-methyltransferase Ste14